MPPLLERPAIRLAQARIAAEQQVATTSATLATLLGLNPAVARPTAEGELTPLDTSSASRESLVENAVARRADLGVLADERQISGAKDRVLRASSHSEPHVLRLRSPRLDRRAQRRYRTFASHSPSGTGRSHLLGRDRRGRVADEARRGTDRTASAPSPARGHPCHRNCCRATKAGRSVHRRAAAKERSSARRADRRARGQATSNSGGAHRPAKSDRHRFRATSRQNDRSASLRSSSRAWPAPRSSEVSNEPATIRIRDRLDMAVTCSREKSRNDRAEATRPASSAPVTSHAAAGSEHVDEPAHAELAKRVRLSKEIITEATIKTAPAAKEVLASTLSLPGEIAADPDKSARVSMPVRRSARRRALQGRRGREEGRRPRDRANSRDRKGARCPRRRGRRRRRRPAPTPNASEVLAEKGLARSKRPSPRRRRPRRSRPRRAARRTAGALGLGASGTGSELALRAPVSGIVVTRDAVVGQPVATDQTIATIADLSEVLVPRPRVREGPRATPRPAPAPRCSSTPIPRSASTGAVEYVGRQIDPVGAHRHRAHPARQPRATSCGSVCSAPRASRPPRTPKTRPVARRAAHARSPRSAASRSCSCASRTATSSCTRSSLGESALGKVEVLGGLREGEQVVVDGVFTLKSVVLKSTFAEEE